MSTDDPFDLYVVVVNDEDQYSIWPSAKPIPSGWCAIGDARAREECLSHIERTWVDMRPRSLRQRMDQAT